MREVPDEYIGWFLKTAHEHNAKVHGFGLTRFDVLKKYNLDSVDSTRWIKAAAFNTWLEFKNGNVVRHEVKCKPGAWEKVAENNLKVMMKLQEYLDEIWSYKKYQLAGEPNGKIETEQGNNRARA